MCPGSGLDSTWRVSDLGPEFRLRQDENLKLWRPAITFRVSVVSAITKIDMSLVFTPGGTDSMKHTRFPCMNVDTHENRCIDQEWRVTHFTRLGGVGGGLGSEIRKRQCFNTDRDNLSLTLCMCRLVYEDL